MHTPELLDGRQFASIADGLAYLQQLGFGTVIARGTEAAGTQAEADVVIGMSMGALPAQYLAQTRAGMGQAEDDDLCMWRDPIPPSMSSRP